ncbi:hypothetical protein O6H91_15G021200 [Diphasiastrum complanatum]|uniref:Uncharacterized protein n=2 Tax=Diphasiastrum complanatum TaxID=34168 RepID=A0ACC2BG71_DIPCM|nr:hypothetical protein O6H91_15G021100 [Diphasiastrum complanatum]KAJ7528810.1 hypothetical protein O6H91_15G021200 [Diphasiastrum complanatum]
MGYKHQRLMSCMSFILSGVCIVVIMVTMLTGSSAYSLGPHGSLCPSPLPCAATLNNFTYANGEACCDYIHSVSKACLCQFAINGDPALGLPAGNFLDFNGFCKVFPVGFRCSS